MCGNGARIGMVSIVVMIKLTPRAQLMEKNAYSEEVVVETILWTTGALHIGKTSYQSVRTAALGYV